ncbi:MAG TPA: hypothetical protein VGR57_05405 [Ktedonobacterales bacterium]|nr:hypothetical protein [Ktedonobacterales bacterium]
MSTATAIEADGIFEIEVSDLRPARQARRAAAAPRARLSTRRRGARFVASLLVMLLLALDLAPGIGWSLPGALFLAPASAQGAAGKSWSAQVVTGRVGVDASQFAPADVSSAWPSLWQRSLRLPSVAAGHPCPATPGQNFTAGYGPGLGQGPVYLLVTGPNDGTLRADRLGSLVGESKGWSGQQVRWVVHPLYQGPVLVRGSRIDGSGALEFNGGLDQEVDPAQMVGTPPLTHLRLVGDSSYGAPWVAWTTYIRVREAGCYAVQVDGLTFSETIVFRAVLGKSLDPGMR